MWFTEIFATEHVKTCHNTPLTAYCFKRVINILRSLTSIWGYVNTKNYWVYVLLCDNQSYYTGYTDNLEKRYRAHLDGTGKCKYTRSFKPIGIAQCWRIDGDKSLAMRMERDIKKLSKEQKQKLIAQPTTLSDDPRIQPFEMLSDLKKSLGTLILNNKQIGVTL